MFVCSNGRGDYLRREGRIERSNHNAGKHPSTALKAAAVFDTEVDARVRCGEMQDEPAEDSNRGYDLRPMLLCEFGQQANERWQAMIEQQHAAQGSTFSDPDAF